MAKLNVKCKASISWTGIECKRWSLNLDVFDYWFKSTTPKELINIFREILITHKPIKRDDVSIVFLTSKKLKSKKTYNNFEYVANHCIFCDTNGPLYLITTYRSGKPSNEFFICTKHLKELTNYLDFLILNGTCELTHYGGFEKEFIE